MPSLITLTALDMYVLHQINLNIYHAGKPGDCPEVVLKIIEKLNSSMVPDPNDSPQSVCRDLRCNYSLSYNLSTLLELPLTFIFDKCLPLCFKRF